MIVVEAALSVVLEAAIKKAFQLGRDAFTAAYESRQRATDQQLARLPGGTSLGAVGIAATSDIHQPVDGELRVELVIQRRPHRPTGPPFGQALAPSTFDDHAVTIPYGASERMALKPGDYLITALVLYIGPGIDRTMPMLAACGQRQVTVPLPAPGTITVTTTTPQQLNARQLGFPADRVFFRGRRPRQQPPLTTAQQRAILRGATFGVGRPRDPAEEEALFRVFAQSDIEQRQRAEQQKSQQEAPTCGARTRVGGPCLDPIVEHGLCHNHLTKARAGGRVIWHATGQPITFQP